MKSFLLGIFLMLLSGGNPIDWEAVMNDFGKEKINFSRFNKSVLFIEDNFHDNVFDSTMLVSKSSKRRAWATINSVMGKCDYVAIEDTNALNCFIIYSNKAYQKFWIKYDSQNKISAIKIVKPKIGERLIPSPCGY